MAAIPGIDFGVVLDNSISPAEIRIDDTGSYPVEVKATATYGAAGLTALALGTLITITVAEPAGSVQLGTYTTDVGDDNATNLAANLAGVINGVLDYEATAAGGFLTVTAAPGLGATINGQPIFFTHGSGSASTNFFGGINGVSVTSGAPDIEGYVFITQPDGITIQAGDENSPAIYNDNGTLTTATGALRLAIDGNFQKGQYSITYWLSATGFDVTVLTKQFTVDYKVPKVTIAPTTDVFTPMIRMTDTTVYTQTGITNSSIVRGWDGEVVGQGLISGGNVAQFYMEISGDYYSAKYTAELTVLITAQVDSATYVTLLTEVSGSAETTAVEPLSLQEIVDLIEALFLQGFSKCTQCGSPELKWNTLVNIFQVFELQGRNGNLNAIWEYYEKIVELIDLLDATNLHTPAVPTGNILTAYNWNEL